MAKKGTKKTSEGKKPPKSDKSLTVSPGKQLPAVKKGTEIAGKGFENLEREDILLPRLKLLQAMSPEVTDADEKPGTMFVNLSNVNVGAKIIVVPVMHYRSRIKWIPKDDGGGIDCSSPDARVPQDQKYAVACAVCPHKEWNNEAEKKKDQAPVCTMYENFIILIGDKTEPVILPMAKTQGKVAKKFYSMMALKGGDMFGNTYELSVVKEKAPGGESYFNFSVRDLGKETTEKQHLAAEQLWATLSKVNLKSKMEPEEQPGGGGSVPAGVGAPGKQVGQF